MDKDGNHPSTSVGFNSEREDDRTAEAEAADQTQHNADLNVEREGTRTSPIDTNILESETPSSGDEEESEVASGIQHDEVPLNDEVPLEILEIQHDDA
ncbi:unnamed protein product [Linum trigynum]|uniref:Uncharacterized protein n=1 Tax=Linum trigynum TaxID=586398 RepID=A0AAV2F8E3_9ROSI